MFGRKLEVKLVKDVKQPNPAPKSKQMIDNHINTVTKGVVTVAVAHTALKTFHDVAVEVAKKAPITVYMK